MKRVTVAGIVLVFCAAFTACSKQHADEHDKNQASFFVVAPTEGGVYNLNDSVLIQCAISATKGLHGYSVGVRNAADTNTFYYFEHIHQHNDTVNIRFKWKGNLAQPANLQLLLEALLDDNGTTVRKIVSFKVQQ